MDKRISQYIIGAALPLLALPAVSCQGDTETVENSIFAPSLETTTTINVKPTSGEATGYVEAQLARKEEHAVEITFRATPGRLATYNALYSADCIILPEAHYSIPSPRATIPAGGNATGKVEVRFTKLNEIDLTKTYVLPVMMSSEYGTLTNDTYYFVIREASLISVVADMTRNDAVFAYGNQATGMSDLSQITVEALLYPLAFPNMLSTIMGIEDEFLLRIGDAGVPANQLQLATSAGKITDPEWTFLTDRWTFMTFTYDTETGECNVYFNGVKKGETHYGGYSRPIDWNTGSGDTTGGPRGFHVGYSYDADRYFNGYMSELRVWNRILTPEEINAPFHFYTVDPASEGLRAYWKLDEGTGNIFTDYANGYDLRCEQTPAWIPETLPAK